MKPLYNKQGRVVAYLGLRNRIIGLRGESKAWIHNNGSVYDYRGTHIGWWNDGYIQGRDGGAMLWLKNASHLGIAKPIAQLAPLAPLSSLEPLRPLASLPPIKPIKRLMWSTDKFFDDVA